MDDHPTSQQPDVLGPRLKRLAVELTAAMPSPDAGASWRRGRRRRVTGASLVAAVLAGLLILPVSHSAVPSGGSLAGGGAASSQALAPTTTRPSTTAPGAAVSVATLPPTTGGVQKRDRTTGAAVSVEIERPPPGLPARLNGQGRCRWASDGLGLRVDAALPDREGFHVVTVRPQSPTLAGSEERGVPVPFGEVAVARGSQDDAPRLASAGPGPWLVVSAGNAQVGLDRPDGAAGTLRGPYRLIDAAGRTVQPAGAGRITFTWSCVGPEAPAEPDRTSGRSPDGGSSTTGTTTAP